MPPSVKWNKKTGFCRRVEGGEAELRVSDSIV